MLIGQLQNVLALLVGQIGRQLRSELHKLHRYAQSSAETLVHDEEELFSDFEFLFNLYGHILLLLLLF